MNDITYIPFARGNLYLAVILDLYSRKVIGWQLGDHMRAQLVTDAIEVALARRGALPMLFHSDQGSQYVSEEVEDRLKGVTISMSCKGNCWGNAVAESFFGTLKSEHVDFENHVNEEQAKLKLFRYIEIFCNRKRKQSFLRNKSPEKFEKLAS